MGKDYFINKILTDIGINSFNFSDLFTGPITSFRRWIIMVIVCLVAFIWIVFIAVYIDYKMKHKTYDGKISKSVEDAVGKYNLDTIDNYEDAKKKLQIERKEIEINKEIKNVDPDFSIVKFKSDVCKTFLDMQKYWSEGNLDEIRDLETDELYEQHRKMLEDFSSKNQKNIREDISIEGCFLNDFSRSKDKENIIVDYVVKMKDYIIDANSEEDIKIRTKKHKPYTYLYRTTFVRTLGTKTNENFEPGKVIKCPNCGADVQVSVSEYCPYCNSVITSKHYGWVISNIEKTKIHENQIKN